MNVTITKTETSSRNLALFAGIALAALTMALWAPSAEAQNICIEYPDLPQCVGPGGGEGNPDGDGDGNGVGVGPSAGDLGDGGKLPFTGYPITPLVAILLALIAAGAALRTYLYVRDRLSSGATTA